MIRMALCPGQGSQRVGMTSSLLAQFPYVKEVFEEAEDALSWDVRRMCEEGPQGELDLTVNAQPCVLVTSCAYGAVLRRELGMVFDYYAGHSLGEYSALVISERLALATAVRLVRTRGQAMQRAFPAERASMAAVLGCDGGVLQRECEQVTVRSDGEGGGKGEVEGVYVANWNSSSQIVVSGTQKGVGALLKRLELAYPGVKSLPLKVSAPFHSVYMGPAKEEMRALLEGISLQPGRGKMMANVTGEVQDPYAVQQLVEQIDQPVLWHRTYQSLQHAGVRQLVEVGYGRVLSRMWCQEAGFADLQVLQGEDMGACLKALALTLS